MGLFFQMSAAFRLDQKSRIPQLNYKQILDIPELTRSYSDLSHPNGHSQLLDFLNQIKEVRILLKNEICEI